MKNKEIRKFFKPNWKKVVLAFVLSAIGAVIWYVTVRFFTGCFARKNVWKGPVERVPIEAVIREKPYCRLVRGDHFFAKLIESFGWRISDNSSFNGLFILLFVIFPIIFPIIFFISIPGFLGILFFYLPWISFFYLISCFIFSKLNKNK